MKSYLKARWRHDFHDEPNLIYSELDGDRNEIRKVEVFSDGSLSFADEKNSSGTSQLSEFPIPPDQDIASDSQFELLSVTKDEFDSVWLNAVRSRRQN